MLKESILLRELGAEFIVPTEKGWKRVETLAEAKGVSFLCPVCFRRNGGACGTHTVICWFAGVPLLRHLTGPGRWIPAGTSLADLSFVGPGAGSVQLEAGACAWHGYVKGGRATLAC